MNGVELSEEFRSHADSGEKSMPGKGKSKREIPDSWSEE